MCIHTHKMRIIIYYFKTFSFYCAPNLNQLCITLPLTDAVRVQLYKMANSPNVVHTAIDVSSLLF